MNDNTNNNDINNDNIANSDKNIENSSGASAVKNKSNLWRNLFLGLLVLLFSIAAIVGATYFGKYKEDRKNIASANAVPIAAGKTIIVPDVTDGGKIDKEIGETNPDPSAPKYVDPANINSYRHVDKDGNVTIETPVDGKCAQNEAGKILPPDNYLHSCYYEKNGSVYYTSHAVIGPKTGALENIQYLKKDMPVIVDGQKYVVDEVNVFDQNNLPDYLFKPGKIGLITCHIDASVKTFKDYSKTDVVTLKKV